MSIARKKLEKFIGELQEMQKVSDARSRMLFTDGQKVPRSHRAAAEASASAYGYVIIRLRLLLEGRG